MQRLGENAMWLREDNLSGKNEIVLPYDEDLILWDRPTWLDSLYRLRWCCPAKTENEPDPKPVKMKKKKKKDRPVNVKDKFYRTASEKNHPGTEGWIVHEPYEPDMAPPPPPGCCHGFDATQFNSLTRVQYTTQRPVAYEEANSFFAHQQLQAGLFHPNQGHHTNLLYSIPHAHHQHHFDHTTVSSLSGGSDMPDHLVFPEATDIAFEDKPSRVAAAAADAAVASLKKQVEKQQQPQQQQLHVTASRNPNLPPLVIRSSSPVHNEMQVASNSTKQRLTQRPSRPVSPLSIPPPSPNADKNRLQSERSVGTASTRHRRQAHESFQFSNNSLQQIVNHDDVQLSRTSPPAYIECPTHHGPERKWSWSSFDQNDFKRCEDDNSFELSIDEEISNLVGRVSQKQNVDCVDPANQNDETHGLRARNANIPAISWINSWAAQGDAAAGNPTMEAAPGIAPKSLKVKEKLRLPLAGTNRHSSQTSDFVEQQPWLPQINIERPVFLPRCRALDRSIRKANKKNKVVVSGWAAISLSDQLRNRLVAMEPLQLKRSDIAYFQMIQHGNSKKKSILRVKHGVNGDNHDITLEDRYTHQFQSQEVCGRAGRCVCLVEVKTRRVLLTILPVSLPKYFFREDELVEEQNFNSYRSALFTPFTKKQPKLTPEQASWGPEYCLTQYAPDEQYDAVTYILFALDSVLKVEQIPFITTSCQ